MQTIWIFILTLGITTDTSIDISYEAKTEDDCWNGRAVVMEQVQEKGDEYLYWYIDACKKVTR